MSLADDDGTACDDINNTVSDVLWSPSTLIVLKEEVTVSFNADNNNNDNNNDDDDDDDDDGYDDDDDDGYDDDNDDDNDYLLLSFASLSYYHYPN